VASAGFHIQPRALIESNVSDSQSALLVGSVMADRVYHVSLPAIST